MKRSHRAYDAVKRVLDFGVALVLIVVLSPILLGLAIAVRIALGSPVIFRQKRPGRDGRIFTLYKFRSMLASNAATDVEAAASDEERMTRFGRFLRASSLDELPELVNILRGEMSFVGPRPLLVEYLERYSTEQARRHEVRPGLTGWAQVNGRNAVSWEDRFAMDVYYVDHRSFALDARIVWMTVATVFGRRGSSPEGAVTMPPFDPSRDENATPGR